MNITDSLGFDAIKAKKIAEINNVRYLDACPTLDEIKSVLDEKYEEFGFPVTVSNGEISNGLFSDNTPCLICYHPEHKNDYFYYVIHVSPQGKGCLVHIGSSGKSRLIKNEEYLQNAHIFNGSGLNGMVSGGFRGGTTGAAFAVGSIIGGTVGAGARALKKGFLSLTTNKQDLQNEQDWYDNVMYVFGEVFS
ncbi:MAG: hypothetical protein IJA92_06220 [Oscillospiraceae bacterium]|nr:hypothetical protein [Oscillospiraceae bacterium]